MTSEERRERRYKRRRERRDAKRREKLSPYTLEKVSSVKSLYDASKEAAKSIGWKASVQKYMLRRSQNAGRLCKRIRRGDDIKRGFICFDIIERGKLRHIKSVHFTERVVQKSLCKNALHPILANSLIYDNGASQKGKGTKFSQDRFLRHLTRHIRRHGRNGYILFIDFKDYFGNIDHDAIRSIYEKKIEDRKLRDFAFQFVDSFDKGLGLGSETSQINAIVLADRADHYAKEMLRLKCYIRHMDDTAIIHQSKEYLMECLEKLNDIYKKNGIILNEKKTKICDLKHGFIYLKTKYFITETGHIIKKPCRDSITRERRKLKRQSALEKEGVLAYKDIKTSYESWKGSMKYRDAHKTVVSMDNLFNHLFEQEVQR